MILLITTKWYYHSINQYLSTILYIVCCQALASDTVGVNTYKCHRAVAPYLVVHKGEKNLIKLNFCWHNFISENHIAQPLKGTYVCIISTLICKADWTTNTAQLFTLAKLIYILVNWRQKRNWVLNIFFSVIFAQQALRSMLSPHTCIEIKDNIIK